MFKQGIWYYRHYDTCTPAVDSDGKHTPLQKEKKARSVLDSGRLTLGDWEDANTTGDEAPIPLIYADGKQSMRRAQPGTAELEDGVYGRTTPNTISSQRDFNNLNHNQAPTPCLLNSLRQGNNTYIRCTSGLSRSPIAAAVISAGLTAIGGDHFQNDETHHWPAPQHRRRMDRTRGA